MSDRDFDGKGLMAILNNAPVLAATLGGTPKLVHALAILAVAVAQLESRWDDIFRDWPFTPEKPS